MAHRRHKVATLGCQGDLLQAEAIEAVVTGQEDDDERQGKGVNHRGSGAAWQTPGPVAQFYGIKRRVEADAVERAHGGPTGLWPARRRLYRGTREELLALVVHGE